jgi:hypothetical protein
MSVLRRASSLTPTSSRSFHTWGRRTRSSEVPARVEHDLALLWAHKAARLRQTAWSRRQPPPPKRVSDAKLALEPVSVYISRATQKLYVRRNTHKQWPDGGEVFDATIEVPPVRAIEVAEDGDNVVFKRT